MKFKKTYKKVFRKENKKFVTIWMMKPRRSYVKLQRKE